MGFPHAFVSTLRDTPVIRSIWRTERRAAFGGLKPMYVIFICLDDPFDAGRPVYTFKSMCEEDASVPFDNGVLDMVLNASGDLALARPQVADLLKFVKTNRVVEDGTLAARISGAVEDAYRDELYKQFDV